MDPYFATEIIMAGLSNDETISIVMDILMTFL